MKLKRSPKIRVRAFGPLACFTRPELKAERVSYPVMTPSAARGILEAVLWKPAIAWHIERISVLAPIRFTGFRRNEVNTRALTPGREVSQNGGFPPLYFADEDRAQRNTVALRDVDYLIHARFSLTDRAGDDENVTKFAEMFRRRLAKGQHFPQPYFGCREFVANLLPADHPPTPIRWTGHLGIMLWDIQYRPDRNRPIFFDASLDRGVMNVPADPHGTCGADPPAQGDPL